jgi:hypothetical protein
MSAELRVDEKRKNYKEFQTMEIHTAVMVEQI